MEDKKINGRASTGCLLDIVDWSDMHGAVRDIHNKVESLDTLIQALEPLKHLSTINATMTSIQENLIGPATGREQIPKDMVKELMGQVGSNNRFTIRVLAGCLIAYTFIIVFLLTGQKFGWFDLLGK